ncbi:hypothetical protein TSAR_016996 [Trichomalopsis sarcophagae]|uniref:Uncharacterized protein n=1 Tax=Trichomalopsis sarcophagae TaxID=543379 RepID=A0A232EI94_9HYME|nr:hypothetical protein TSAR_016996 [Trichomalopsis sarcophagae]
MNSTCKEPNAREFDSTWYLTRARRVEFFDRVPRLFEYLHTPNHHKYDKVNSNVLYISGHLVTLSSYRWTGNWSPANCFRTCRTTRTESSEIDTVIHGKSISSSSTLSSHRLSSTTTTSPAMPTSTSMQSLPQLASAAMTTAGAAPPTSKRHLALNIIKPRTTTARSRRGPHRSAVSEVRPTSTLKLRIPVTPSHKSKPTAAARQHHQDPTINVTLVNSLLISINKHLYQGIFINL